MVRILGVDSGTSVVKAVLFDLDGTEVAVSRREMPVQTPVPGASEVDMRAVWRLTSEAIREVVEQNRGEPVAAVGISGTACGYWGIDENHQPVRPAILWNDGRPGEMIQTWQKSGFYKEIFQKTGNAPFPGYPLSILGWLQAHEPETLDRTRWLLFHKDWLRWNLCGDIHTDLSDMSYFPGSLDNRDFSVEMLQGAGLNAIVHKLPPLLESEAIAGRVTKEAAAATGLPEGTPVSAGAVDVVASVLGGGVFQSGQACSVLGTSFLNSFVADQPSYMPPDTGVQACMPNGRYVRSLVNTSGTINIEWMRRVLVDADSFDAIEDLASDAPLGAQGLVFLPYLNTAGIVSPFASPNARGMFFGLSMEHTRADMVRAVYEGTALAMRDCYAVVEQPVNEVVLVGGGARSDFWAQMFADVTGKRILIPEGTEFGARGAAMTAAVGTGLFGSYEDAVASMIRPHKSFTPDVALARKYDALYELYRHLYQTSQAAWDIRADVRSQLS